MGDFNLQPEEEKMKDFMDMHDLYNMIKVNTCFKGLGTCIDLILTNKKYSFKNTHALETGLSDHHLLIYTYVKNNISKVETKNLNLQGL